MELLALALVVIGAAMMVVGIKGPKAIPAELRQARRSPSTRRRKR